MTQEQKDNWLDMVNKHGIERLTRAYGAPQVNHNNSQCGITDKVPQEIIARVDAKRAAVSAEFGL